MNRKIMRVINIMIISVFIVIVNLFFLKIASAQSLYGCLKEKAVSFNQTKCKDGSRALPVKEGYLVEGDKVILDTLSDAEKEKLGIRGDNKVVVVMYKSDTTNEASFSPGVDQDGNQLKKSFLELKYFCTDVFAEKSLHNECLPISGSLQKVEYARADRVDRKSITKALSEDSRQRFYNEHKKMGLTDKEIANLWERHKVTIYKQYNYDPKKDKFIRE